MERTFKLKVSFSFQENNSSKSQKQNINFGAGLTPKMVQEIKNADVIEISKDLSKKGVDTDFKGNKIIAWCCQKTVNIFEQFNSRFKMNLSLPKGIYVEDFEDLNIKDQNNIGFCNMAPTYLKKNSTEITPAKTLFFNSFQSFIKQVPVKDRWQYDWRYLNKRADKNYAEKFSSTDIFLEPFFHEFTHVIHETNMIKTNGPDATIKSLIEANTLDYIRAYKGKYGNKISQICGYAEESPSEAIACDISKIIADSIDENLRPVKNPFKDSPYEKLPSWQRNIPNCSDKEQPLNEILRNFWNGKFD